MTCATGYEKKSYLDAVKIYVETMALSEHELGELRKQRSYAADVEVQCFYGSYMRSPYGSLRPRNWL